MFFSSDDKLASEKFLLLRNGFELLFKIRQELKMQVVFFLFAFRK